MRSSDEGIEEIVVRGESQGAEDFVATDSVTAFSAADIQALGAQTIEDLAAFTPNLEIVAAGATTPTFFIRGVGLNDFNANAASAVAIYQDDVNLNAQALQLGTLFDVEAVNVLRGPQGTGLARNSSAGAIKLYTRKPIGRFNGYLRGTGGNFDYRDYEGAVEAPVWTDILSARAAFRLSERDGFAENRCGGLPAGRIGSDWPFVGVPLGRCVSSAPTVFSGDDFDVPAGLPTEVNDLDVWAVRGTLLFEPTLDMSWLGGAQFLRREELSRLGQAYGAKPELGLGSHDNGGVGRRYKKPEVALAQFRSFLQLSAECAATNCGLTLPQLFDPAIRRYAPYLATELDDEPFVGYYDRVGPTESDVFTSYLRGEIHLPYGIELRTVGGYAEYDRLIDIDIDFSPSVFAEIVTEDEGYQLTQDVAFDGDLGDWDPATWGLGGFFLYEDIDVELENYLRPETRAFTVSGRKYTQQIRSFGAYGEFERDFWDDYTLDGGVRWNWENKEIRMKVLTGFRETPEERAVRELLADRFRPAETWQAPTGTIRLTYRFREDTRAFWKYTRGWKAGHFNATAPPTPRGVSVAEPETIDAFETGVIGSWFDGRVSLDLTGFYYAYEDYQVFTTESNFGALPAFVVLNADNAEVYGAEADLVVRPWAGAFLNARASWLESRFTDFVQFHIVQDFILRPVTLIREVDNTGHRLLNSPRFKVSLSVEQALPLGPGGRYGALIPRYDGVWTDEAFFDGTEGRGIPNTNGTVNLPKHTIAQRAFFLHNARLSYALPAGGPVISLWVRNIEDTVYRTFGADASIFLGTSLHFVGEPRTYGVDVIVHF